MKKGYVAALHRFPLKGAKAQSRSMLAVDRACGVEGDRRYAVRRKPGDLTKWSTKGVFFVGMNTPRMVTEQPQFDGDSDTYHTGDLSPEYLADLRYRLGVEGELLLQDTRGEYSLSDTPNGSVSFLNMATVRALSEFVGSNVDPHRFRMNVWMEGLEPFEELSWVDQYPGTREIAVGDCRFRVDDACERCKATEANPDTGKYDLETLTLIDEFMASRLPDYRSPHRGKRTVMGILAVPVSRGVIRLDDPIGLC